ncbi:MAG: DNRLRE domain-containing protein [Promethearchaeota archaeon]
MRVRTKKQFWIIFIIVLGILALTLIFITAHFRGFERTIKVEKDAYVAEYDPKANFGADEYLRVGNYDLGRVYTFYHFNISSLPKGWRTVAIIVNFDYGSDMVDVGGELIYEKWDEMTITWNNKPKLGISYGYILCDGFDFRIPLKPDYIVNDGISICLYGRGGENDGYIQGYSKEGAPRKDDIAWIELNYIGLKPQFLNGLIFFGILFGSMFGIAGIFILVMLIREDMIFTKFFKKSKKKKLFGEEWLNQNLKYKSIPKATIEEEINQYITLKLINGRTHIYVNGKRFIQCIRLILNIPRDDISLYDEVDSIDEAAKVYNKHVFQNRIVRGPMARPDLNQSHDITPEQEFWGHCSNIQAWVEHDYDTRILMSNISFPLLRELTIAGDPKAKRIYKEEIALRLESGYPSVVQYLLTQGYLNVFNSEEFRLILETSDLIKNLSSDRRIFSQFLRTIVSKFPRLSADIITQILNLPKGKDIFISSILLKARIFPHRPHLEFFNPKFLLTLKTTLENLMSVADEDKSLDIVDCIQAINLKLSGQEINIPRLSRNERMEFLMGHPFNENALGDGEAQIFAKKFLNEVKRVISRCAYCGKEIPKDKDSCEWCGHKRDDDEDGFFPYPFIFKPPGGGGGRMKEPITVTVKTQSQT